jgi:ectoine hydroxylase-related dioxygenase (phytanoyl-CoA dioxygenase family)
MIYQSYSHNISLAIVERKPAWRRRTKEETMPKMLSSEAVQQYHRDGYYFPVPVLSQEEAAHYRRCLEQHEAKTGEPLQGNWRHKTHLLFTWADKLVHDPKILDAVEDVIGPDILCWTTNFFIKEANNPGFVSWHQDSTYWGLDPDDVITAWVAFTDATPENGYMQFMPASHKVEQLPHVDTFHKDNLLSRGQEIAVDVDESKAVGIPMRAGEMSLHHIKLVHGSDPNRSNDRRIGLAIRYIPTYVRQTKVRDSAMLVRGTDQYHHFDYEPRPRADLDEAALAAHADAVARQVKALYQGTDKQEFRA